MQSKPVY